MQVIKSIMMFLLKFRYSRNGINARMIAVKPQKTQAILNVRPAPSLEIVFLPASANNVPRYPNDAIIATTGVEQPTQRRQRLNTLPVIKVNATPFRKEKDNNIFLPLVCCDRDSSPSVIIVNISFFKKIAVSLYLILKETAEI